jgi:hypothetical protein
VQLSQVPAWAQAGVVPAHLEPSVVDEQKDDPSVEVNPASQAVQDDAPLEAYLFASQIPVTAVRPDVAQYEPPSHGMHALMPVLGW